MRCENGPYARYLMHNVQIHYTTAYDAVRECDGGLPR